MKNSIGQNIAYYRKKLGMTQEELSEKMNVTAQAVSKWENDILYPDLECIGRLAKALDITVNNIIDGEEAQPVVRLAESDDISNRILLIKVKDPKDNVSVRIPIALINQPGFEEWFGENIAGNDPSASAAIELIKRGTIGEIVNVETDDTTVKIEVVEYDS